MIGYKKTVGIVQNVVLGEQRKRVGDGMYNGISAVRVAINFNPYDALDDASNA